MIMKWSVSNKPDHKSIIFPEALLSPNQNKLKHDVNFLPFGQEDGTHHEIKTAL